MQKGFQTRETLPMPFCGEHWGKGKFDRKKETSSNLSTTVSEPDSANVENSPKTSHEFQQKLQEN